MKHTLILCGGKGLRLNNGGSTPKALVRIKGVPLVERVMRQYGSDSEHTLLIGHGGDAVRLHYLLHPNANVKLLETGEDATTGTRLQIAKTAGCWHWERLCVAYCDCLANVDVDTVLSFHRSHGKLATLVAIQPRSRYGVLRLVPFPHKDCVPVLSLHEKPATSDWVNFGYFVFEHAVQEHLCGRMLEVGLLPKLAEMGELMAYKHAGFAQPVDSPKDIEHLEGELDWEPLMSLPRSEL